MFHTNGLTCAGTRWKKRTEQNQTDPLRLHDWLTLLGCFFRLLGLKMFPDFFVWFSYPLTSLSWQEVAEPTTYSCTRPASVNPSLSSLRCDPFTAQAAFKWFNNSCINDAPPPKKMTVPSLVLLGTVICKDLNDEQRMKQTVANCLTSRNSDFPNNVSRFMSRIVLNWRKNSTKTEELHSAQVSLFISCMKSTRSWFDYRSCIGWWSLVWIGNSLPFHWRTTRDERWMRNDHWGRADISTRLRPVWPAARSTGHPFAPIIPKCYNGEEEVAYYALPPHTHTLTAPLGLHHHTDLWEENKPLKQLLISGGHAGQVARVEGCVCEGELILTQTCERGHPTSSAGPASSRKPALLVLLWR